jgi:hypothetical protein
MLQYDTYPTIDHVPSVGRLSLTGPYLELHSALALTSSRVLNYVILLSGGPTDRQVCD